jgi:aspartyl-tRNA(Asn)/glutamyl-tRNA(Gln) amidotransferase subunit A
MNELLRLSLVELAATLRRRDASPVELMDAVLARIDATNADLNAIVAMHDRERLREQARAAEERIGRGEARALEGIPLGVKDLEDAAGLVTSYGSLPWKENLVTRDSTQVERLRRAGAIVVGKTNAPEHGYTAITKNLVYGVTRSPWNLERTPGGSSGGSAAALTAALLPLVTASDGGGSVRIPASFTGCFGLKVSYGRIPNGPDAHWTYRDTAVHGPLTRTVEDAALFLDQVVGPSAHDANSLPHPGISYLQAVQEGAPQGLRIAFSPDLGQPIVQPDVAETVQEAVRVFDKRGHRLEEIVGGPPPLGRQWAILANLELAGKLYPLLSEHEGSFGRSFLAGLRLAWNVTPEWFGDAARLRMQLNDWCSEVFERYDALVTPTVPYDPPPAKGPFPVEPDAGGRLAAGVASFTLPFNLSWHPVATVRAGLSRAGLPIGLQIVGPRHRDDLVLRLAREFERERPWHPDWPVS